MCSGVCLQAQKKNKHYKEMYGTFSSWWKYSFFLHFLNIQDALECIYDFYNQEKMCLKTEKLV